MLYSYKLRYERKKEEKKTIYNKHQFIIELNILCDIIFFNLYTIFV